MKRNKLVLLLFTILAVVQLAQPLYMVWRWEDILQTGTSYRWRTMPVDPYDALRGRYIDLWFKDNQGPVANDEKIDMGQTVYASLGQDGSGFAYITDISTKKPEHGDYVEAQAGYMNGGNLHIILPFKRFYMREDLAPLAERTYQRTRKEGAATVKIKHGMGVIEQLSIDNIPIEEYLRHE